MARCDPEAPERVACGRDLYVGLRVETPAVLDARLEQAELLELAHALRRETRALAQLLELDVVLALADGRAPAPPLAPGPGGKLLPDDPEWQELVALQPQDRLEPLDVLLAEQPVSALCALQRQQALVLEVADLRDRDVRELRLQPPAAVPDRVQPLRACRGGRRHQCWRKVSRYLPIWISSPSSSSADSTRRRLTKVPFRLPWSSITQATPRCTSTACRRDTVTSSRKTPQSGERPIVVRSPCGENVSPVRPPPERTTSAGPSSRRSPSDSSSSSRTCGLNC